MQAPPKHSDYGATSRSRAWENGKVEGVRIRVRDCGWSKTVRAG